MEYILHTENMLILSQKEPFFPFKCTFFEKKFDFFLPVTKKAVPLHSQLGIVLWCNGSTSDSGSACEGSNPSRTTNEK